MNDVIRLLPDSVANQIAAGEVIQRPSSVVKELVENAVDAGATEIKIYIKDAGRTLIQVLDNGVGMSETDARLAFERHATSKIRAASDLFSLNTMGFRGEALPSICAISQVELRTRREDDELGSRLLISGSKVELQEKCVCTKGCNFMVKNIFFNVPARRRFLKSDSVELGNIMREFERLALVNHNIRMSIDTGSKVYDLRPGSFKQRISEIWKNNLNLQLVPLDVDTALVKISGFISRPEFARRRNPLQYLIVNGRNMKHPAFHKAIVSSYESLIAPDTQPCYFIRFDVDPATIDVNIHPTKSEIKFENEKHIWSIIQASIKSALGKFSATPQIDFTSDQIPFKPAKVGDFVKAPTINIDPEYNPFEPKRVAPISTQSVSPHPSAAYRPTKVENNWERLYDSFVNRRTSAEIKSSPETELPTESSQMPLIDESECLNMPCIQYVDKFIVTTSKEGLMIIDQHRAHVKILFEKYLKKANAALQTSQRLMFAETIELDATQQLVLEEVEDELKRLGFIIVYAEDNKWEITGVPPMLEKQNPCDIILQIIDTINEGVNDDVDTRPVIEKIALILAQSSAIKGGQILSRDEMDNLVQELLSLPDPMFTPLGNPVVKVISEDKIRSLFI